jgi:hypothetical protein
MIFSVIPAWLEDKIETVGFTPALDDCCGFRPSRRTGMVRSLQIDSTERAEESSLLWLALDFTLLSLAI